MRNVLDKSCAAYEIVWKNTVEAGRWRM